MVKRVVWAGAALLAVAAGVATLVALWAPPARAVGLGVAELGLVINEDDPYSVAVGQHYIDKRGLQPQQVLRLRLPAQGVLTLPQFERLTAAIDAHFGEQTQALALAWRQPYAVQCASITGALALGLDPAFCSRSCDASPASAFAMADGAGKAMPAPGFRLSMLLAAADEAAAKALIDRGVAADGSLVGANVASVQARFLFTTDRARNVRAALYPAPGWRWRENVEVMVGPNDALPPAQRVLLMHTGVVQLPAGLATGFVDGAVADHLTSFGGRLDGAHGQSTVLEWISAGATASYGTVSEPCNHVQKFPHPQRLLNELLQGATVIEAYWRSVLWPLQGLFVGEPLAAPYRGAAR